MTDDVPGPAAVGHGTAIALEERLAAVTADVRHILARLDAIEGALIADGHTFGRIRRDR